MKFEEFKTNRLRHVAFEHVALIQARMFVSLRESEAVSLRAPVVHSQAVENFHDGKFSQLLLSGAIQQPVYQPRYYHQ